MWVLKSDDEAGLLLLAFFTLKHEDVDSVLQGNNTIYYRT